LTERQQLQKQLQQSQKMEAIGQLTGGIAHDFNNMLSGILGYTELAREELAQQGNEQVEGYLNQVYNSGTRARDLVAQMLAFSRGGEGECEPLKLAPMIRESLKMLGSTLPSSIEVDLQLDDDDQFVMTNPVQVHQIVMNLCINARDAMEGQGHITIKLQRVSCPVGDYSIVTECYSCHQRVFGDYIELIVRDNGPGIQPEQLDRIFDPFFTTKEVGKGSGMGLSMVHGIMHDHGGHVLVESVLGKGTTFTLLFPVVETQVETVNKLESSTCASSRKALEGSIMVVDDEATVGSFIGELLKSKGCQVTVETDSQAALSQFMGDPDVYDLVVTDQTMPGMTGVELSQALLAICPDLPVILCTGYSEQVDEARALSLGLCGYVKKPIDTKVFLELIEKLLRARGEGSEGAAVYKVR
jgi:nitrogen-specific signal transduction histidine kinase/ActR/RegA family two-component response regulator